MCPDVKARSQQIERGRMGDSGERTKDMATDSRAQWSPGFKGRRDTVFQIWTGKRTRWVRGERDTGGQGC